jgi:hypothetical protein
VTCIRSLLLLVIGLFASSCGETQSPPPVIPFVPVVATSTPPPPVPPVAALATSSVPPLTPGAPDVLRVADLLGRQAPPGAYVVEAYVMALYTRCPPCPPHVVCSPCHAPEWFLVDAVDAKAATLALSEQPPPVAIGGRYRLRVEPVASSLRKVVRVVAVLSRAPADERDGGVP